MKETLKTAFGLDPLNPSTLFNPFKGQYHGGWVAPINPNREFWWNIKNQWERGAIRKIKAAFRLSVWRIFLKNLRYEFIDRPRYRKMSVNDHC